MTRFKRPVPVLRNSLAMTWEDASYEEMGSGVVRFARGTRRVTMDADVHSEGACIGRVRLISSTGSASGIISCARERHPRLINLNIDLLSDVDGFIEGANDWVMIQYEV